MSEKYAAMYRAFTALSNEQKHTFINCHLEYADNFSLTHEINVRLNS